ncbi:MAG: hypothetical protein ACLFRZ_04020, partial [Rhodosalinus sp.]
LPRPALRQVSLQQPGPWPRARAPHSREPRLPVPPRTARLTPDRAIRAPPLCNLPRKPWNG